MSHLFPIDSIWKRFSKLCDSRPDISIKKQLKYTKWFLFKNKTKKNWNYWFQLVREKERSEAKKVNFVSPMIWLIIKNGVVRCK